jgi:hypothetical protein
MSDELLENSNHFGWKTSFHESLEAGKIYRPLLLTLSNNPLPTPAQYALEAT